MHLLKWMCCNTKSAPRLALHSYNLVKPLRFFHESATIPICSSAGQIHEAAFSNQLQSTVASPKTLKAISLKSVTWHLTLHSPTRFMSQWIADISSRLRWLKTVILLRLHQGPKSRCQLMLHFLQSKWCWGVRSQIGSTWSPNAITGLSWGIKSPTVKINETKHLLERCTTLHIWLFSVCWVG